MSIEIISKIPKGKELGWFFNAFNGIATIIDTDGKKTKGEIVSIDECNYAELSSRFGKLFVGWNGFYGQWAFQEEGGAVTVLYSISPEGDLFVAGGYEKRILINGGEEMFTPPGGFGINKENPEDTAKRETLEEIGFHVNSLKKVGEFTPNRAFWIKENSKKWPVSVFACRVDWSSLRDNNKGETILIETAGNIAGLDKLSSLIFLPIEDALSITNDGIALAALAKTDVAFIQGIL